MVSSPGAPKPEVWQAEQPQPVPQAPKATPKRPSLERFFKTRDQNQDGVITLKEYIGNPKGRNLPVLTERFKKLDANGDGNLDSRELKRQSN